MLKVDYELCALLGRYAEKTENGELCIYKDLIPSQKKMISRLSYNNPKTYKSHLQNLIEQGYLIDFSNRYIFADKTLVYVRMGVETIQLLADTVKEEVWDLYVDICKGKSINVDKPKVGNMIFCLCRLGVIDEDSIIYEDE